MTWLDLNETLMTVGSVTVLLLAPFVGRERKLVMAIGVFFCLAGFAVFVIGP